MTMSISVNIRVDCRDAVDHHEGGCVLVTYIYYPYHIDYCIHKPVFNVCKNVE